MNAIFFAIVLISSVIAGYNQITWIPAADAVAPMQALAAAMVDSATGSVTLAIGLIGVMALFLGLMKVAEEGGLLVIIAKTIRPLMVRAFPEVPADHPAMGAMILNFAANALGLGNAATPFGIVTSDYVGPDRRKDPTRGSKIPLIAAPNTLRDKALGEWDPAAVRKAIEATFGDVRIQKLIRRAVEVTRLADLMLAENSEDGSDRARTHLERLHRMVGELDEEARNQELEHICVLCQTAIPVVETLRRSVNGYRTKDLELLKQLSLALRGAIQPDEDGAELVHDIAATVGGKN